LLAVEAAAIGALGGDPSRVLQRVVLGTSFGEGWIVRELAVVVLIALAVFRLRRPDEVEPSPGRRRATLLLFAASAVLAGAMASTGHAGSATAGGPIGMVAMAIHLLAAATWTGGLVGVLVIVLPLLRGGAERRAVGRTVMAAFGWLAGLSVIVLAITGIAAAGLLVLTPDALFLSRYGQTLILKTVLVLVVGLLGLRHAAFAGQWLGRFAGSGLAAIARADLRWTLVAEVVGVAGILLFAAALSSTEPARGPAWEPATIAAVPPPAMTTQVDDLIVTVAVRPDRPGPNFVTIGVHDTRRPSPGPVDRVMVGLTAPDGTTRSPMAAAAVAEGRYEAPGLAIAAEGSWTVSVAIERTGMTTAVVRTPWTVLPAPVAIRPPVISDRRLADLTTPLAVFLLDVAAAALTTIVIRRRVRPTRRAASSEGEAG
jgi:copper transport protein